MKEKFELVDYVHKDANMAIYTTNKILDMIKDRDNKIKGLLQEIIDEYKDYLSDSRKELEGNDITPDEEGLICKMWANMEITRDVKKDNSDSSIADMMIKGITMSNVEIERVINEYDDADKEHKKLAKKFFKFQEKTVDKLKKYL